MKIVYTNTVEDMAAWHYYSMLRTMGIRRRMFWPSFSWAMGVGLFGTWLFGNVGLPMYVTGGVPALLVFLYMQVTAKGRLRRSLLTYAEKIADEGVGNERELEITEDALVARSVRGMNLVYLHCIDSICRVEGYTFIYVSKAAAHVLPEGGVTVGDYEGFVAELRERCETVGGE